MLEGLGPPVLAVHGNVDEPALRMRLPRVRLVDAAGATHNVTHDGGPADRLGAAAANQRRHLREA